LKADDLRMPSKIYLWMVDGVLVAAILGSAALFD
jgi:hypothetical protein